MEAQFARLNIWMSFRASLVLNEEFRVRLPPVVDDKFSIFIQQSVGIAMFGEAQD